MLLDVLRDDPQWSSWSLAQLRAQSRLHELSVNPVIYAELSLTFVTLEALDAAVKTLGLSFHEIPRTALYTAGKAFGEYRRRGGTKHQVLPDFFIGAHAAVQRWPLLTRDAARFRTYFPTLTVIAPNQVAP